MSAQFYNIYNILIIPFVSYIIMLLRNLAWKCFDFMINYFNEPISSLLSYNIEFVDFEHMKYTFYITLVFILCIMLSECTI